MQRMLLLAASLILISGCGGEAPPPTTGQAPEAADEPPAAVRTAERTDALPVGQCGVGPHASDLLVILQGPGAEKWCDWLIGSGPDLSMFGGFWDYKAACIDCEEHLKLVGHCRLRNAEGLMLLALDTPSGFDGNNVCEAFLRAGWRHDQS